jgi:hypothetical protein
MSDANPEITVLWRGETALRLFLKFGEKALHDYERADLLELLPELERIRLLRVARWTHRKRAKQAQRRAKVMQQDAYDRVAKQVLARSASRDHKNGGTP